MNRIYLEEIIEKKRNRLKEKNYNRGQLIEQANNTVTPPSFYQAMKKEGLSIIGEVKKASPSRGIIKESFDPIAIAKEYASCVDAVSVLTEEDISWEKMSI